MWAVLILALSVSAGAYHLLTAQKKLAVAAEVQNLNLAGSMSVYRSALIAYLTQNPALNNTSVALTSLQAATPPVLPRWYPAASALMWDNYIDGNGIIYVYASAALPRTNITSEIVALSKNSILAGEFRTGDTILHSPIFADTQIPLPNFPAAIPNGSPLWLAHHN